MSIFTKNHQAIDDRLNRAVGLAVCQKVATLVRSGHFDQAKALADMQNSLSREITRELFYHYKISERPLTQKRLSV